MSKVLELKLGTPLSTVINQLMTSDEYLINQVDALYTTYLSRHATPFDELVWSIALRHESSEQVTAFFLGTEIYFRNHPGATGKF